MNILQIASKPDIQNFNFNILNMHLRVAEESNIYKIQSFQSIALNAQFYISNNTIHSDLYINTVEETAKVLYKRSLSRLTNHPNPLISALNSEIIHGNPPRRLKRSWCRDLNL